MTDVALPMQSLRRDYQPIVPLLRRLRQCDPDRLALVFGGIQEACSRIRHAAPVIPRGFFWYARFPFFDILLEVEFGRENQTDAIRFVGLRQIRGLAPALHCRFYHVCFVSAALP